MNEYCSCQTNKKIHYITRYQIKKTTQDPGERNHNQKKFLSFLGILKIKACLALF